MDSSSMNESSSSFPTFLYQAYGSWQFRKQAILLASGSWFLVSHKSKCLSILSMSSALSMNEIIFIDPKHLWHNNGLT